MPEPAFCDLVRVIEIYTGFDDRKIRLGIEKTQIMAGNGVCPEYVALLYGRSMDVPMDYWREILHVSRRLTDGELDLLEKPAVHE